MNSKNIKKPKFSIITGVYNHIKYLPKLIESLNNQTFQDFEWIVCDDGSNDGTKEYLKDLKVNFKYKYKRLLFKRGMRLAKNINQGIKEAKGEYCLFIMGDSFPETNYLELLNDWAIDDRIICGIRANVDNNNMIGLDWRINKGRIPKFETLLPSRPYPDITGNGLCIPTEAMRKYGGWNEKLVGYGGDDNEIVARLYFRGYLVYSVPQLILYHHYHKTTEDNLDNNKILRDLIESYAK